MLDNMIDLHVPIQPDLWNGDSKTQLQLIPFGNKRSLPYLYSEFRFENEDDGLIRRFPDLTPIITFAITPNQIVGHVYGSTTELCKIAHQPDTLFFSCKPIHFSTISSDKIPFMDLVDHNVDFTEIIKDHEILSRLMAANSFQERINVFNGYLKNQFQPAEKKLANFLLDKMIYSQGSIDFNEICELTGYTVRYCRKHFYDTYGILPKKCMRILRMQHTMRHMLFSKKELVDISMTCGYSDQAHFNNDFKYFTSETPMQFYKKMDKISTDVFKA